MRDEVRALLEHEVEVFTALAVSSSLAPFNDPLYHLVRAALYVEAKRLEPLDQANQDRAEAAERDTARLHRAADKYLTPAKLRVESRRKWARMLWQWLWLPERYRGYGFEDRPSLRRIRRALATWTPPCGDALSGASNGSSEETKGGSGG